MIGLAGRKAKANVVGIVGLVENMPDGNSVLPWRYYNFDVGEDY
jgi:leucyl aminopeptidase